MNGAALQQMQFPGRLADTAGETAQRLDLDSYSILDTPPEKCYDGITQLAAEYFGAAACTLNFADKTRVWTKSHYGPCVRELPRENSIFEMVIAAGGPVVISDLHSHPDFQRNRLHLRQMRFVSFAAVPVFSTDGFILGMLAVFHQNSAASFSAHQIDRLVSMAGMASTQLELQKVRRHGAWITAPSPFEPAFNDHWPTSDDLLRAVDRHEFQLYYQPEVDLVTRRIVGVEALIRWVHPTRGLIPPKDFIPQAEDSGIILPIGDWGMAEACRQIQEWNRLDPRNGSLRVLVNLSALQFSRSGLADHVESLLVQSGTPSHQLSLELTESALMTNLTTALDVLSDLRSLGVSLLMDDFGTGYSSQTPRCIGQDSFPQVPRGASSAGHAQATSPHPYRQAHPGSRTRSGKTRQPAVGQCHRAAHRGRAGTTPRTCSRRWHLGLSLYAFVSGGCRGPSRAGQAGARTVPRGVRRPWRNNSARSPSPCAPPMVLHALDRPQPHSICLTRLYSTSSTRHFRYSVSGRFNTTG